MTHEQQLSLYTDNLMRSSIQYHEKTCVRFVPRSPGEPDYLFIGKVDG